MKSWSAIKSLPCVPGTLDDSPRAALEDMHAAGLEVRECYRVLERGEINLVSEILKDQGTFYEDDHYPDGDVIDAAHASQYYYHAHRGLPGEHGHIHTFLRAEAIEASMQPLPHAGPRPWPEGDDTIVHLGAISMDRSGYPLGIFMTNRWVTGESWYGHRDLSALLSCFAIDHAYPSWPLNRWLGAFMRLFAPQLRALFAHRDLVVEKWSEMHPDSDVYEDRELDITGWQRISVDEQMSAIEQRLA